MWNACFLAFPNIKKNLAKTQISKKTKKTMTTDHKFKMYFKALKKPCMIIRHIAMINNLNQEG